MNTPAQTTIELDLLKKAGLSTTHARRMILKTFLVADIAISQRRLCYIFKGRLDKATIYRTLRLFVNKNLLHVIPTTDVSIEYALNKPSLKDYNHPHFICEQCKRIIALEHITVPVITFPSHLMVKRTETYIYGICNECASIDMQKTSSNS